MLTFFMPSYSVNVFSIFFNRLCSQLPRKAIVLMSVISFLGLWSYSVKAALLEDEGLSVTETSTKQSLPYNKKPSINPIDLVSQEPLVKEEITITSYQYIKPIASVIAPTIVLHREDILRSQANSVVELLRRLPGINLAQSGGVGQQSSLFIRGTESRHVLVLIDGIRLNQANITGASDVSQIPLSMIHKIEYIRGARSALYGSDAIGGVINLITYPEHPEETKGQLTIGVGSFDTQRYELTQQLVTENTVINGALSFNRSQGTDAVANMPEAGSVRQPDKDGYKNQLGWLAIAHQFSPNLAGHIRTYAFKNENKYDGFHSFVEPLALIDERQLISKSIDGRLNWVDGQYALEFIATHNVTDDYNFDKAFGKKHQSASNDKAVLNQFQLINSWRYGKGTINIGTEWQQQMTEQIQPNQQKSINPHLTNQAIFITGQHTYEQWIAELALRHDEQSQFGGHQTYHFGVSHPLWADTRLSLSFGHAYKAPNLLQLYSHYGGNTQLKPEESLQYEIGLEGDFKEITYRLSAYHNEIEELIDYQNSKFINVGEAVIKGSELELSKEYDNFSHKMTLVYLDAKDKKTGERLVRRANKQLDYELNYTLDNFMSSINYHVESRRNDIRFNPNNYKNEIVKLPINQQVDLSLSYDLTTHVTIRGRIADIFNQQRETVYGYQPTGRAFYITGEYRF